MVATWANRFKDFIAGDDINPLLACDLDSDDDDDDDIMCDNHELSESESSSISRTLHREILQNLGYLACFLRHSFFHILYSVFMGQIKQVGGKASQDMH